jgi:DNA repair protein RadC
LLGFSHIARGTGNTVLVKASDVAHPALVLGAKGVVIAHNHPTGDPTPSRADREMAESMSLSLELVNVRLLGALVVTSGGWRSVWEPVVADLPATCDRLESNGDA